ncbi:hypothetical protein L873DRAFT_1808125 [Choiromyces venosus 120613-1]|uniref:Uncharacterized protein n=1 Tax=Choiromyces venosus 120613-1 TaxID=1336337 RepID=A0A3N4JXS5_9PEZI|nr:hypothetical protein L873DRAFT_1808125 [Choiromyces venosus 120613-1]
MGGGLLSRFAGPPNCRPFGPPIPTIHSPPFLHLPFQPPTPALMNQMDIDPDKLNQITSNKTRHSSHFGHQD